VSQFAQFDVCRNTGKQRGSIPFVVIVQSSFYDKARRRVAVPLVALSELGKVASLPSSPINPVFRIEGIDVVLNPLEIVSVPIEALGETVTSLSDAGDTIIAALDELFSRAWC
jgi:toxin CcdB